MYNLVCKNSCKSGICRRGRSGVHPSPPTILKNRIISSNVKELCDLEVLDLSKRTAKKLKEAPVSV